MTANRKVTARYAEIALHFNEEFCVAYGEKDGFTLRVSGLDTGRGIEYGMVCISVGVAENGVKFEPDKQFRKEHKNVLLFDCGDISQGTPYYNMFRGEVEVKLMNEMGYDAMTIGNHEFDFDVDNMERIFKMANFPVVCANYNLDATVLKDIVKPYVVLEKYGLRIGVFGLGTQPEGMIQANKCEGVVYEDPIRVSNEIAALLKDEEGCDLVVCLSHLGIQMDEHLVAGTHNIDVILGGHSHTFMEGPKTYLNMDGKEVPVMHTGKNGVRVGRLDLTLEHK